MGGSAWGATDSMSVKSADVDVVVVGGGGVAGLYLLYRLRGLGLNVTAFEAGSDVGGTWYWNRYPGCRCDVDSLEYSYSFANDLQQEWHWPERYGTQPEILKYVNHVADRFDLRRYIQFNTRVTSAVFDANSNLWTVTTDQNDMIRATFCVMATGNLSTPRKPDFPGIDDFEGEWYHTGLWPHEGVDFTGLRVGVIGTGSSGVQSIPYIAAQAQHLHVFQRTANFSLPARNGPMNVQTELTHKAEYPARRKAAYDTPFGIAGYPPPAKSALEVPADERDQIYEDKWAEGGSISFLYAFNDLLTNKAANDTASEFVRQKIRSMVKDQEVAQLLAPHTHPMGTKRLILDTNYYETYNRDNVALVDVKSAPIEEITKTGLRTAQAGYELDAIVFATGFDAMTGAMLDIDIRVKDGASLKEAWSAGPRTYLGLMIAGFPNLFTITGPGSPGVKSNMMLSIEQHTNWIVDCLQHLRSRHHRRIEVEPEAEESWVTHVREVADSTLYPLANSWYMGANIPGKPLIFMPYVGGVQMYKKKCDEVVANGYEGFSISG
jgi:cyclohexanone monooxygenase